MKRYLFIKRRLSRFFSPVRSCRHASMPACRHVIAPLLAILALPPGAAQAGGVIVTDGDSLKIDGERVRLWGVDAPELGQKCEWRGQPFDCGRAAKDELIRLTQGRRSSARRWTPTATAAPWPGAKPAAMTLPRP
jgi:endonuclease YncB( thermonuclease family)